MNPIRVIGTMLRKGFLQFGSQSLQHADTESRPARWLRSPAASAGAHANFARKVSLCELFGASLRAIWRKRRDRSRETVAGWTLNRRAASAAALRPFETIFLISDCC